MGVFLKYLRVCGTVFFKNVKTRKGDILDKYLNFFASILRSVLGLFYVAHLLGI